MKKLLAAFAFLFFSLTPVFAGGVSYPELSGQVVDEAGVLSPQTKAELSRLLALDKNNQGAVAVVKDLRGQNGREYGIELARRWQLGQKGWDNGVLLLISVKDRYAGLEVGYGLESVLPDSVSGRILREAVLPPLKQNQNYNKAALNGVAAVMSVITGGRLRDTALAEEGDLSAEDILLTLIVIYLILSGRLGPGALGLLAGRGGRGGGGFRGGGGGFGGGGAGGRF